MPSRPGLALFLSAALAALAAGGCDRPASQTAGANTPSSTPPFNSDIDVDEVMVHVMDPAARAFWAGWGEVYDANGLHDVSAHTDDEWKRVEDGAATVVLATNTLMLPAYQRKPEAEWNKWAKKVADLAMAGKNAAEDHNIGVMEELGGQLDVACDQCHEAFREE